MYIITQTDVTDIKKPQINIIGPAYKSKKDAVEAFYKNIHKLTTSNDDDIKKEANIDYEKEHRVEIFERYRCISTLGRQGKYLKYVCDLLYISNIESGKKENVIKNKKIM